MRFLVYLFCLSVLTLTNLKLNKTREEKNTFIQGKLKACLTFNPGLALIDFRTTGPWRSYISLDGKIFQFADFITLVKDKIEIEKYVAVMTNNRKPAIQICTNSFKMNEKLFTTQV